MFEDIEPIRDKVPLQDSDQKIGLNQTTNDIIAKTDKIKKIDFSKYEFNNWRKTNNNKILNEIKEKGAAIWLDRNGELCYRFSQNEMITKQVHSKANIVFTNFLDKDIKLLKGTNDHREDVKANDLLMVHKDVFSPQILQEFYHSKNLYYRNIFKPTNYLQAPTTNQYKEPKAIQALILHLVNGNEEYYDYFINWLSYFFQGLKKPQVSIVLRGSQGAGKGILFDQIIKHLFGKEYCIQINDKTLKTNYLGSVIENKLFYNLDEISHDISSNKQVKNFLKALVTNNTITAEKKYENIDNETPLHGAILITSNEPYIIEVETSDRRFSVFSTGNNLSKCDFLGYRYYTSLSKQIKSELEDFCKLLGSHEVNVKLANTALDTKEKQALINATNDKFKLFVNAIKTKDTNFFIELEDNTGYLYNDLIQDFDKNRIHKENLTKYFSNIFESEITSKQLMNRVRAIDPHLFDKSNISKSNGKRYFKI